VNTLKTVQQKFCTTCGMPLILVGRYVPTKLLGQGGFGAAFLARDRYTPAMRKCVVKQFQPSGDLNPQQLAIAQGLFEREGEVLEQLGVHPQIPDLFAFFEVTVPSLQAGKESRFFYLAQEFIEGRNMEEEVADRGPIPEKDVLMMLAEVLSILKFVHDNNSIHRDIKPSNIMRSTNGRFYLIDFGAVKQVAKVAAPGASKGSTGIYTMGFAPQEQMSGSEVYPSTDLFALAATCVSLLTGKQPSDLFDSYNNRWNWRGFVQINPRFADVLDRMLLPTPNQRFASATEVMTALTQKAASPPPAAAPMVTPSAPTSLPVVAANPPPQAAPPPPIPVSQAPVPQAPIQQAPARPLAPKPTGTPFSLLELLGGAAFTGFEGGLVAIALTSLLKGTPLIGFGVALAIIGGLVFLQSRRTIERFDLLIIAGITVLIMFVPALQFGGSWITTMLLAGLSGLVGVAMTTLFRLIYNLLSRFM